MSATNRWGSTSSLTGGRLLLPLTSHEKAVSNSSRSCKREGPEGCFAEMFSFVARRRDARAATGYSRVCRIVLLLPLGLIGAGGCGPGGDEISTGSPEGFGVEATPSVDSRASRAFAGPGAEFQESVAVYGILAFQSRATTASRAKYIAICEAYIAAFPSVSELEEHGLPLDEQMVTVWPLDQDTLAGDLNEELEERVMNGVQSRCDEIVDHIDLVQSLGAIHWAQRACDGVRLSGDGPYLLAWSVPQREEDGCAGLRMDFSNVTHTDHATRRFRYWREQIQERPELWRNGWSWARARFLVEEAADLVGPGVLALLRAAGSLLASCVPAERLPGASE